MIHLFGSGFGQNGSTRYLGGACARASEPTSSTPAAQRTIAAALILAYRVRSRIECLPRSAAVQSSGAQPDGKRPPAGGRELEVFPVVAVRQVLDGEYQRQPVAPLRDVHTPAKTLHD